MFRTFFATTILALTAQFSAAGTISLSSDLQGASLNDRSVDMSVYITHVDAGVEVVAIYATHAAPSQRRDIRMVLAKGEETMFGLPNIRGLHYHFSYDGEAVTVVSTERLVEIASN